MLAFGKKLPGIRRQVARDLALPGLPRPKILATVVRLLEISRIRVGNEEYARQNNRSDLPPCVLATSAFRVLRSSSSFAEKAVFITS